MKVYLDGFFLLRIESDAFIESVRISDKRLNWLKNEGFNQFFVSERPIDPHKDEIVWINEQSHPIQIGVITLTKEFEHKYRYDGPLGYRYHPSHTEFFVFTPVAKDVILILDEKPFPMTYQEPIWTVSVPGDWDGKAYHYRVRLVETYKEVKDPYTNAASLERSHVMDWNKLSPIHPSPIHLKKYVDAVIYEGHIRDMTIGLDVPSKGLYKGLREISVKLRGSLLQTIKRLGMTHLQLLPIFDFEGVDDVNKDQLYNWGYNPSQYFAVEGWYSKHPEDPYHRINHLRKVINEAHRIGLGINMDVVYNHVYQYRTFPYDDLVPGYFYRHTSQHKMTDASYCGNDVETRHYMVRRLIIDSLVHFATQFQIDGFRFDLMGLLDIETMHQIEKRLKAIRPSIMLYGEGWNMPCELPSKQRASMQNHALLPEYGFFNDTYRNVMKGELHGPGLGYAMGNKNLLGKAMEAITGSAHLFSSFNQSINYVECHDNLTFYDKMLVSKGSPDSSFKIYQDLANHVLAISQGVPFYHAGQEHYRSKKGIDNSYNSPDLINKIEWDTRSQGTKKLKEILKLRKRYSLYRQDHLTPSIQIERDGHLIQYRLSNDTVTLLHYIKNTFEIEKRSLESGKLIFASQKTLISNGHVFFDQPGVYIILIKK